MRETILIPENRTINSVFIINRNAYKFKYIIFIRENSENHGIFRIEMTII